MAWHGTTTNKRIYIFVNILHCPKCARETDSMCGTISCTSSSYITIRGQRLLLGREIRRCELMLLHRAWWKVEPPKREKSTKIAPHSVLLVWPMSSQNPLHITHALTHILAVWAFIRTHSHTRDKVSEQQQNVRCGAVFATEKFQKPYA